MGTRSVLCQIKVDTSGFGFHTSYYAFFLRVQINRFAMVHDKYLLD